MDEIFKRIEKTTDIDYSASGPGRYGFIIDKEKMFYLPKTNSDETPHRIILNFTIKKLMPKERVQEFEKFQRKLENITNLREILIDEESEFIYSSFLANQQKGIFLNTSIGMYTSGVLFLPQVDKTRYQEEVVKDIIENFEETNDLNSLTIIEIKDEKEKISCQEYTREEYIEKRYQNGKTR